MRGCTDRPEYEYRVASIQLNINNITKVFLKNTTFIKQLKLVRIGRLMGLLL